MRQGLTDDGLVALQLDVTRRPRQLEDWTALLRAIYAADPTDEGYALEWKSRVDLTNSAEVGKSIARELLAFANRSPALAAGQFEGFGILVVGVAPDELHPPALLDSAELTPKIAGFVGEGSGPRWDYHYVPFRDTQFLVLDVAAPVAGDRIYALRKPIPRPDGKQLYPEGAVFIRRGGTVDAAKQADFDALLERARSRPDRTLDVAISAAPAAVNSWTLDTAAASRWLQRQREILLATLDTSHRATEEIARQVLFHRPRGFDALTRWVDEDRSEEQFRAEVDQWAQRLALFIQDLPGAYGPALGTPLTVIATNQTGEPIEGLRIRLTLRNATVLRARPDLPDLHEQPPKRPRAFGGYRIPLSVGIASITPRTLHIPTIPVAPTGPTVRVDDGLDPTVELNLGSLRAHDTRTAPTGLLFFVDKDRTDDLTLLWRADAKNLSGRSSGELPLTRTEPIDVLTAFTQQYDAMS